MSNCRIFSLYMFFFFAVIPLFPILAHSFSPDTPESRRVLVLVDDLALGSSHSLFFNSLKSRGFDLQFKLADDPSLALHRYGQYLFDALIIFSPSADRFGGNVDLAAVLDFVDSGHDLILAADDSASDFIKSIANECGVDFDEDPSSVVIDHLKYSVSPLEGDHTLIAADNFIKSEVIIGKTNVEVPVIFKGVALSLNLANSLVLPVLSASSSAYSAKPYSKSTTPPKLVGSAITLVSAIQARNNARILISGSLQMFSNRFFRSGVQQAGSQKKYEKAGNEQFLTELSKWVFHERGHLKAMNIQHHKIGEVDEPGMYRIKDDLDFSFEIYQWSGNSWEPYIADDVQVQFYMMSPYVLKTMSNDGKGLYHTSFKVPDVYGVFQFKIDYNKLGYTSLSLAKQIPVRPFRHNEYERFITAAYPYYGASFATMAGFFIFSFVFLYHK